MSCYMHVFLVIDYSFRWRTQPAVFFIYEVFVAAIHVDLNKLSKESWRNINFHHFKFVRQSRFSAPRNPRCIESKNTFINRFFLKLLSLKKKPPRLFLKENSRSNHRVPFVWQCNHLHFWSTFASVKHLAQCLFCWLCDKTERCPKITLEWCGLFYRSTAIYFSILELLRSLNK